MPIGGLRSGTDDVAQCTHFIGNIIKGLDASIGWRPRPRRLFDPQQLIIFGGPIRAAQRAGLDLTGVAGHHHVRDRGVFRFPRAVRHHRGIAGAVRPWQWRQASQSGCQFDSA